MPTILDRIVETKRREVAAAKIARPLPVLQEAVRQAEPPRDFLSAVATASPGGIRLIAEIKKASPSAGVIVENFDPVEIATVYQADGVDAISVLTDRTYFQGEPAHINEVKKATTQQAGLPVPVLRKDFLVDEYQVWESRANGADAVLLIAEILDGDTLARLHRRCCELEMASLVEVHCADNLRRVLATLGSPGQNGYILGINNRDLAAQKTDLRTTERLASLLPVGAPFAAESGIDTRDDVLTIQRTGARAMLVGESILRSADHGRKIRELMGRD